MEFGLPITAYCWYYDRSDGFSLTSKNESRKQKDSYLEEDVDPEERHREFLMLEWGMKLNIDGH